MMGFRYGFRRRRDRQAVYNIIMDVAVLSVCLLFALVTFYLLWSRT